MKPPCRMALYKKALARTLGHFRRWLRGPGEYAFSSVLF
jgi:hypothetical protein